jgi:diadenosine tetraphosphate (Ap4A) HIT family hydrolase
MAEEKNIVDLAGKTKKIACLGCARENGEINLGDIVKTKYFDAHQDYEIPIPGFVIISSRRHIQSVDEFTEDEQRDFIKFLCRLRSVMRKILDIETIYLFQAEDTMHHFHIWLVPRYDWMTEKFGTKIESVRPIVNYSKEFFRTESDIAKVEEATQKLKQFFSSAE